MTSSFPREALELEDRSIGASGEPTLFAAFVVLRGAWQSGDRTREVALHLLFLCWYLLLEPPHLTGYPHQGDAPDEDLVSFFNEVHDHLDPGSSHDAELLFVVGLMARLSPWLLGDNAVWEARSSRYRTLYRQLAPSGIDPDVFRGRGAYGDYFAGQARVVGGY